MIASFLLSVAYPVNGVRTTPFQMLAVGLQVSMLAAEKRALHGRTYELSVPDAAARSTMVSVIRGDLTICWDVGWE